MTKALAVPGKATEDARLSGESTTAIVVRKEQTGLDDIATV
jgi:hypothetical protein